MSSITRDFPGRKMNPTILFDLDDTLLKNPMEQFLPAYLQLLGNDLKEYGTPDQISKLIYLGSEKMSRNLDSANTLETCFDNVFYPALKHSKQEMAKDIANFYESTFPKLASHTYPISIVPDLIKNLKQSGFRIAITTNPLFPLRAIQHRLNWAGLPSNNTLFEIITAYETFHFAKPNPEYIAETLAQMGWPDGLILMVGNDWKMDIKPAEKLGIPSYFVGSPTTDQRDDHRHPLSTSGPIDGVFEWANNLAAQEHHFECRNAENAYTAILRSTPAAISSLLKNLSADITNTRPFKDEWSIVEILSHLLDVDREVNLPRIDEIKTRNKLHFAAILTDQWADSRDYQASILDPTLQQFIEARKSLVNEVHTLSETDYLKPINHTVFGPTTPLEIIRFMAQHDRIHVQQIYKTINTLTAKE